MPIHWVYVGPPIFIGREPLHLRVDIVIQAENVDASRVISQPGKVVVARSVALEIAEKRMVPVDAPKYEIEYQEPACVCMLHPRNRSPVDRTMMLGGAHMDNLRLFIFPLQL